MKLKRAAREIEMSLADKLITGMTMLKDLAPRPFRFPKKKTIKRVLHRIVSDNHIGSNIDDIRSETMGCDIHMCVLAERPNGVIIVVPYPDSELPRDYELFAEIGAVRGAPETDATLDARGFYIDKALYEIAYVTGCLMEHSATFYTLGELELLAYATPIPRVRERIDVWLCRIIDWADANGISQRTVVVQFGFDS